MFWNRFLLTEKKLHADVLRGIASFQACSRSWELLSFSNHHNSDVSANFLVKLSWPLSYTTVT